jgi:hypothetical protein
MGPQYCPFWQCQDWLDEKAVKADVAPDCKGRHSVALAKRNMTMTNTQTITVLSDTDLDAVVGGLDPFLAAFRIYEVEHSNEPNALKAVQIHNIEAATRWPFFRR